ncbi:MAG: sulfatase [Acidimicrobiia bacterium]
MTRARPFLVAMVIAAATIAVLPVHADAAPRDRRRRPNIVFVLTDDMSLSDLAVMPATRRLIGDEGATFDQFLINDPACCPSRATILTGRYAHNTGVWSNGGTNGGFETAHSLGLEKDTIATRLQAGGYRTGLFGKYLNGYPNGVAPTDVPPGWGTWVSPVAGDPYSEYGYSLNVDGRIVEHGSAAGDYGTDVYARAARRFIRDSAQANEPFFAAVTVYAPHQPAVPAPEDTASFTHARAPRTPSFDQIDVSASPAFIRGLPRFSHASKHAIDELYRRRVQSLQDVDRQVARLVNTLRDEGQLDDTYFVFSSDNGFHLGQHRLPAGKYTAYETDIHVPLLIRGPGIAAGEHIEGLTGNVDLAPTFEAMAGVPRPAANDGRSLLRLAQDPEGTRWTRTGYLIEHRKEVGKTKPARDEALPLEPPDPESREGTTAEGVVGEPSRAQEPTHRSHDYALLRRSGGLPDYDAVRTVRWLYVEYVTGERELYDLRLDPDELVNLAGKGHVSVEATLGRRLDALRSCAGSTCRASGESRTPTPLGTRT